MKCTECNDTRVYYGLGTAPVEPCRACLPTQEVTGPAQASTDHVISLSSKEEPDRISMVDTQGRRFQASIDEWCEAMQVRVDRARQDQRATRTGLQEVTGPARASDDLIPKLSVSSLSDGQYLIRDWTGIVECRVPKVR